MVLKSGAWGMQPPAVTGYQDTTTIIYASITVSTTSVTVTITSPFHVVNTQARTAAVCHTPRCRTAGVWQR